MNIRPLHPEHREPIKDLLRATDVFSEDEISIALELIDVCITDPHQKDYEIFSYVDEGGTVQGYVCVGPTPATTGTFDLYWIAVSPDVQGKKIGSSLMKFTEEYLKAKGGRLLIAETSSTPKYDATRAFYLRKDFSELARIREYYKPGDDLVIYGKYL
jgi:ribosomal protein S18 acetylase RimI-like enzyme